MKKNLVIGVLGHRNSGKSKTWNDLFGTIVKTGTQIRHLYLTQTEYIELFLVSGSPEERETYVGDIIGNQKPRIVLCSMQYILEVNQTIDFFTENDYSLYIQWLNPGHHDIAQYPDYLGIINKILYLESTTVSIRSGKIDTDIRIQEIIDYLYGWAKSRDLLISTI